jgi:NifU-like protein
VKAEPKTDAKPKLTNIQKIRLIEETIEREIRPSLKHDGGDIEIIDIIGNRVIVAMRGACSTCKASEITLKDFVQHRLRELVSPDITVEEASK